MTIIKPFFVGEVKVEWLHHKGEDRQMRLLADVSFTDSLGHTWTAPAGTIVDGASIPRFLWRVIDPFIGDYRRASVVHDKACQEKTMPSWYVHRMFREGMLTDGVPAWKAWPMWAAVRIWGPRFPGKVVP